MNTDAAAAGRHAVAHAGNDPAPGAVSGTRPAVSDVLTVQGFSSGQGQNAGLGFVMFKDWAKRDKNESAMAEADQANQSLALVPDGTLFSVVPPSVEGMGNSSGFALRLQDRAGLGREALLSATETLIKKVFENPQIFVHDGRGPVRRAGAGPAHRPQQGRGPGRAVRRHQLGAVHRLRLGADQRVPQQGPHAARDRAGPA